MNLSELFIRRPVLTVLLNSGVVVAGVIAFNKIPANLRLPGVFIETDPRNWLKSRSLSTS